jgi:apolipoprotein N-acyltransferase
MPVAALLSGALLAGAGLPVPVGPVAFVALVPLLRALLEAPPLGRAFRDGLLVGLVFFGVGFGWGLGSDVGGGLAPPLAYVLAVPMLASGIGLFAVAVAWIARRGPRLALAAAPGLWIGIEFLRSQDWGLPIPWLHLGYALADQPFLMQGASLFGLYGLSAWIVAVNAGCLALRRLPAAGTLGLGLLLGAPLALGLPLLSAAGLEAGPDDRLRVAAVQPAIAERERHVPERLQGNLRRVLDLTGPAVAGGADLVVWPESAWERVVGSAGDAFLAAIAHDLGTPVVTGAWHAPRTGDATWRNTAVLATRDGRTPVVAEKVHPVPVYERAPEGPLSRRLAQVGLWSGRFARGRLSEPLALPRAGAPPVRIGVLVCVDASYPELARAARQAGAQLLVAIANEAGSGAWSAALHARMARLRAVENRLPVVRVANTGPTLWIDAYGRVSAALAPGAPASGVYAVALAAPLAAPARAGDAPVVASGFLSAFAIAAARFIQSRRGVE